MTILTKRILIYPYSNQSKSAKLLKEALGAQFIKKIGSQYEPRDTDLVINWGSTDAKSFYPARKLNSSFAVRACVSKMYTFISLTALGVSTLDWTTSKVEAKKWFNQGHTVVVRGTDIGSGGAGIEIYTPSKSASEAPQANGNVSSQGGAWDWFKATVASNTADLEAFYLPDALLYTKYIEKEAEFRVHAAGDKAIHVQMKLRKHGVEPKEVWNHDNGYVFTSQLSGRVDDSVLSAVQQEGIKAVDAVGLDFGAVDIAWANGRPYVLEVNSAPGIEEPTLSKYVNYFKSCQ